MEGALGGLSPHIARAIVLTFLFFLAWVIIITTMVYIFKASVRRFDFGIPGQVFLLLVMLFFLLIPIRICQIAFDAVNN